MDSVYGSKKSVASDISICESAQQFLHSPKATNILTNQLERQGNLEKIESIIHVSAYKWI